MPLDEWRSISADGAPPGVYVPNMSDADAATWRAKKIGGADPRVEIRVLKGSQVLVVVRPHEIRVSMNGPAQFTNQDFDDLHTAVREAMDVLEIAELPVSLQAAAARRSCGDPDCHQPEHMKGTIT
jgi:hypothetical protein